MRSFKAPGVSRQLGFHQLLVSARKKYFMDALTEALSALDQNKVKNQITDYVPDDVQRLLAAAGLRDEYVFPVPIIIEARPTLIGYFRLLLGAPQKTFYKGATGMGLFKSMEEMGTLSRKQQFHIPDYCKAMAVPLSEACTPDPQLY